jgi:hypothetical protein
MAAIEEREFMMSKKQLIPTVAAIFLLAGCGASSAAASGGTTGSTLAAAHVSSANHPDSSDGVPSSALPFPVGVGDTWVYRATGSVGAPTTVTNKILSATSTAEGLKVTEYYSNGEDSKFNGSATWIFHPNGTITFPATENMGIQIKNSSGGILLPTAAEAASGVALHSTLRLTAVAGNVTVNEVAHVTVQGAGTQTVTVPAGTYRATVVNMTMSETIDGIAVSTEVRTWLATGVGPVQSEVFLDEGGTNHVAAKDQLVSFKAG